MRRVGPRVYPRAGGGTCRNRATAVIRTGLSPRRQGTAIHEIERGGRQGLSPRRRGNRSPAQPARAPRGSIPALGGEPTTHSPATPAGRVYPRAGGGTSQVIRTARGNPGLSPRRRGNPAPRRSRPAPEWVYPRAGGGTDCSIRARTAAWGLSPRRRGNQFPECSAVNGLGSIPAQAGEPSRSSRRACPAAVYPRAGGEPGSPRSRRQRGRVYPRAGGGTLGTGTTSASPVGLSPRRRGNLYGHGLVALSVGSIPAQAGEPVAQQSALCSGGVYPRAGGGTDGVYLLVPAYEGLSPRRRGNRHLERILLAE